MFSLFLSPRNLRAPLADRRETLPHDRKLREFCNASSKTPGALAKKLRPKHAKFGAILYIQLHSSNDSTFMQLQTLIANISGTSQDIQNRKDM